MFKPFTYVVCVVLILVHSAHAEPVNPNSDLGVALTKMARLQGFSADFKQEMTYAEGGKRVYSGKLAVLRPGKFKWRYLKPYEQLYVSNGDGIWLYEPDLMQAQKLQDLGEVDPVVLQLLDGRIGLADVHILEATTPTQDTTSWHVRIGKSNQMVTVWLGVSKQTLHWFESRDVLGNRNRLYVMHMDTTPPDQEIFEFVAPDGVDVIDANGVSNVGAL